MSAVISPSSPRFVSSSGDLFAPGSGSGAWFDGAQELSQAWRDGLLPDPALTVSEWADRHRVLSPRASAEPGRYRTLRVTSQSISYTAAQQTADFGAPPALVAWRVAQVSRAYGRGVQAEALSTL